MSLVMIVDDSPTERAYCSNILRPKGYDVVEFANGEDALANVKAIKPDVILLDIVMPKLNGFQTCRMLKKDQETCDIPVIFLSSKDGTADLKWGLKQGATTYLVKPAKEEDILNAIKSLL